MHSTYASLVDSEYSRAKSTADITLTFTWVMKESHFQWNQSFWTEVNALSQLVGGPVPHVEMLTVVT